MRPDAVNPEHHDADHDNLWRHDFQLWRLFYHDKLLKYDASILGEDTRIVDVRDGKTGQRIPALDAHRYYCSTSIIV